MPTDPKKPDAALSEEELEKVAGGTAPPEPDRRLRNRVGPVAGLSLGLSEPPDPDKIALGDPPEPVKVGH